MPQEAAVISVRYDERDSDVGSRRHQSHSDGLCLGKRDGANLASERPYAKSGGLRARTYGRHILTGNSGVSRTWQRRVRMAASWKTAFRVVLLVLLVAAIVVACFTLPIDKVLNDFLIWIHKNLGPWGPAALALAYIPLTVLAVPASILTIGGGYLFGLPIGFLADSVGATLGATAAFLVGKTIGRSFVTEKLKEYPQFQAVALAIQKSGFKIIVLLRLVPLLPFNILNYLLSVTPVKIGEYMLASWIGMMPITLALVYVGTTIKDLSDVSHGWGHFTTVRWILLTVGLAASVAILVIVTRVAKKSLSKAILESEAGGTMVATDSLTGSDLSSNLHQPLVIRVDHLESSVDNSEN